MGSGAAVISGCGARTVAGHMSTPRNMTRAKDHEGNSAFSVNPANAQSRPVGRNDREATTSWVLQANFLGTASLMQSAAPVARTAWRLFRVR